MERLLIGGGVVAALVGLGFVFPALAHWRDHRDLPVLGGTLLALGTVLTLGGLWAFAHGIRAARA